MSPTPAPRLPRKSFVGTVVADRMTKTIVVDVDRLARHAKYGKTLRERTRLYAHDEREEAKTGDVVEIASTRPLSRLKRWRLVRIVRRAAGESFPEVAEATAVPGALAPRGHAAESSPEHPSAAAKSAGTTP